MSESQLKSATKLTREEILAQIPDGIADMASNPVSTEAKVSTAVPTVAKDFSSSAELSKADVLESLPDFMTFDSFEEGKQRDGIFKKFLTNPFAFIGAFGSLFFLGRAMYENRRQDSNRVVFNQALRNRCKAQAVAIVSISGAALYQRWKDNQLASASSDQNEKDDQIASAFLNRIEKKDGGQDSS